ncbi:MAG: xylulokinase [Patescibacteria group bacterium]|nr:xylulokinase [Patescibacteria group bacterium]
MAYYLGVDLGTSIIKGLAINDAGQILTSFSKETPLISPKSDWAEQSPEFWWSSTLEIINLLATKIDLTQVQGIGLSGQMHGLVTYGSDYQILRRAIIWMDKRSSLEVEQILKKLKNDLYKITGNPIFTGFLLPSLLWLKKNEPDLYQKIAKISSPKDYLAYKLTGNLQSEPTDALASGAFAYQTNSWSNKIIKAFNLKNSIFPEIKSTLSPYGTVTEKIAKITRLPQGIPVYGASDQAMSALGTGLVQPGQASVALSTGGQFLVVAKKGIIDPKRRLHTLNHAVPKMGLYMAATLSAGYSLRWFKDAICNQPEADFKHFTAGVNQIPIGSNGLFFLPFLNGERTPYFNPNLRGTFIGLTNQHKRLHLVRAIMEGVAFSLRECLNVFQELKLPINKVILSGGGSQNPVWRQILADVLNLPMKTINISDHSPFGAAILAKFAQEGMEKLPAFYQKIIHPIDYLYPNEKNVQNYRLSLKKYQKFSALLNQHYEKL